jgi:hypothetical protein
LRQSCLAANSHHHADKASDDDKEGSLTIHLICYASHPSDAMRRYTLRKLTLRGCAGQARHLIIDYNVAPAPSIPGAGGPDDTCAGDVAALCRFAARHAVAASRLLRSE